MFQTHGSKLPPALFITAESYELGSDITVVSKSARPCKNDPQSSKVTESSEFQNAGIVDSEHLGNAESFLNQSVGYQFLGRNSKQCAGLCHQCPRPRPWGTAAECDMPGSLVTGVRQKPHRQPEHALVASTRCWKLGQLLLGTGLPGDAARSPFYLGDKVQ